MVLYRKFRPVSFSDFYGNEIVKKLLISSIKNNLVSSAYLISGPRGTGKTSLARIFAKALSCENFLDSFDVCNSCQNCISINSGSTTDIIEIDAASNRRIDDVRLLREEINLRPIFLKKKVYIIDEVHMLTNEAFNALLKTLEEPPEDVIFILATTEPQKIPLTILSRLIRLDLRLQSADIIVSKLKAISKSENRLFDDSVYFKLAMLSGGSFRDAESLFSKILLLENPVSEIELYELLGLPSLESIESLIELLVRLYDDGISDYSASLQTLSNILSVDKPVTLLIDQALNTLVQKLNNKQISCTTYSTLSKILLEVRINLKDLNIHNLPIFILLQIEQNTLSFSSEESSADTKLSNGKIPLISSKTTVSDLLVKTNSIELEAKRSKTEMSQKSTTLTNMIEPKLPIFISQIINRSRVDFQESEVNITVSTKTDSAELSKPRNLDLLKIFYGKFVNIVIEETNSNIDSTGIEGKAKTTLAKNGFSKINENSDLSENNIDFKVNTSEESLNNSELVKETLGI